MSNIRAFKQKLAAIFRLWEKQDYDAAFAEVESLLAQWPGNARLHVLWANLVQLQENPTHDLDEVKQALQHAVELDKASPAASIELGHFLDTVEDDPQAAAKVFAEGVAAARTLLIEGLIAQAKALRQVEKNAALRRCLLEILYLAQFDTSVEAAYERELRELLSEVAMERSAMSAHAPPKPGSTAKRA